MPIEYEARVLNVNPVTVEARILNCGGGFVTERAMRRYVFDVTPGDRSRWLRLRDDGQTTTLTLKETLHTGISGVRETEMQVEDFEQAHLFLTGLGYHAKSYQESRRTSYTLDGAAVELDFWPRLKPLMEIESNCEEGVLRVAKLLGYSPDELTTDGIMAVYARAGIDLSTIPDLRFEKVA